MDSTNAHALLGWTPRYSAALRDTLPR
jgi:hypothetical protein